VSVVTLRLGPVEVAGYTVRHSGIRWLYPDGHVCRAGDVVAYATIGLLRTASAPRQRTPFAAEARDLQVAFATPVGGILRQARDGTAGGFLDLLETTQHWHAGTAIGAIDCAPRDANAGEATPRLLFLAGQRVTELSEGRGGLQSGFYSRARAWWGEPPAGDDIATVLSMGICELLGVMRGEQSGFIELFESVPGPAHMVFYPNDTLVPCAAVLTEQLRRTPAQFGAIAADMAQGLLAGQVVPRPADWLFAGCLLQALEASPLTETAQVLGRSGLREAPPPRAVVTSVRAEPTHVLRHRKLGYTLALFRANDAGPAVRAWLASAFETVARSLDDIAADYTALFAAARQRGPVEFLIVNTMSSNGGEDVFDYAPFDAPLGDTLASIRAKETNLMLHDLARAHGIAIIDADAMAAELGGAVHLADGVHQSGALQNEIRAEIVRVLGERGLPGFGRAAARAAA